MPPVPLPDPSTQYHEGAAFELYPDVAPNPTAGKPGNLKFTQADREIEAQPNGRLKHCAQYTVPPHAQYPSHRITLRKGLSVGLSHLRFAQVWMVECEGRIMVARFYDPLYVSDDTGAYDIFRQSNERVGTEVAAYTALTKLQGTLVPRFVGYFLAMVPALGLEDHFPPRSAQVVLLEFLPGDTLRALGPGPHDGQEEDENEDWNPKWNTRFTFVCDEHKNAILDAVLLANHLLILRGIQHSDLMDRNVLLKETPPSSSAFCSSPECALQHSLSTESLIQKLESQSDGQPVDYSKLTPQQIDSLPIAVIDFGSVRLVEYEVKRLSKSLNALSKRYGAGRDHTLTAKHFENASRPDSVSWKDKFYESWRWSKWLPSTHDYLS